MNQYKTEEQLLIENSKNTVLIVDDEATNIQLMLEILQQEYRVLVATSGEQALKLLSNHNNIDLMLLDIDMPGLSGFDVLHTVKQTTRLKFLPVIMVTARNKAIDEALSLEHGANDYIAKPISAVVLKSRIKTQIMLAHAKSEITQKNTDLKQALIDAKAAKEELSQFTSMISHELRTPIAVLKCEIELLVDGIRKPDKKNLSSLMEEIEHFNTLINDMFELVLSDARSLNYNKEICYLEPIISRSSALFKWQFKTNDIEIHSKLERISNQAIYADPKRIKQVIDNILKNTLKYTNADGQLNIFTEEDKGLIWVHFQDSTPGVNENEIEKLFDRFYRAEKSRNRETGGAGLGLSICKTIMEDHDGKILARPSPHGGLWISIGLPKQAL